MDLVTEAFPIVVFAKQLEDKSRKIMEIMECEILPTGERRYNTLYHFKIEETGWRTANTVLRAATRRSTPSRKACRSGSSTMVCRRRC